MATQSSVVESRSPLSGDLIDTFAITSAPEVHAAVDGARIAGQWWADLGWRARRSYLMGIKRHLARHGEELAALVHAEMGKPLDDARLEIALTIEHVHWAANRAESVLGERRVSTGLLTINQRATLAYQPVGVVAVIGPWNYPVFTPMGSIIYALAAGNAVVFKPSEWTTATGAWLVNAINSVVTSQQLVTMVCGPGDVGAALCVSGANVVSFTGSAATGRHVLRACAESLTPVVLECGGKDAALVDEDADLITAADAIVFGALSNAGQTCVGIERVYAHHLIRDELIELITERASRLETGTHGAASYGPMTLPTQADLVSAHLNDALARGGTAVLGGPSSLRGRVVTPIVLVDVPEDSTAVQEETFGPTIVINTVRDLEEGVDRANATGYGLAASVFGRTPSRVRAAARNLRVGMVSINSWVMYAGVPELPWGGVGESGAGRIHGADGLRAFSRAKATVDQRFALPISLTSFERPPWAGKLVMAAMRWRHGGLGREHTIKD